MAYSVCNTLKCNHCGLIFLDVRFDDSEMSALYTGYRDAEYTALRVRFEPDYQMRNDDLLGGYAYIPHVEEFLRARIGDVESVLDWGGDTGVNTPFRHQAAVHHVYDISGKPVIAGVQSVEVAEAMASEYDLVVLSQVLEHVPFPREVVADVAAALGPNAVLWVEVPHEAVIREAVDPENAYLDKRHWHEHVNFFTDDSLVRLLESAGLEVMERTTFTVTVSGKSADVMGAICRRQEALPSL